MTFFSKQKKSLLMNLNDNEYIKLRPISSGSSSTAYLIYHIEKGELFAIKMQYGCDDENSKLFIRELNNCKALCHPLLPIFHGIVMNKNELIIEFIMRLGHSMKIIIILSYFTFSCKITGSNISYMK